MNNRIYKTSFINKIKLFFYRLTHSKQKTEQKKASISLPLFDKIENPKIFGVILVKNEEDIIDLNINFHKNLGIDGFIVTDNGSTDKTYTILKDLLNKKIINELIYEPSCTYTQDIFVDRMIQLAISKYHADYVLSIDADEFWYPKSKNFHNELSEFQGNLMYVNLHNVIDENNSVFWKNNKILKDNVDFKTLEYILNRNGLCQYNQFSRQIPKVIIRAKDYIKISMGNHDAQMIASHLKIITNDIMIYHYCSRGLNRFKNKFIDGGKAFANVQNKNLGVHWRYFYKKYCNGFSVDALYREYTGNDNNHNIVHMLDIFLKEDNTILNIIKLKHIEKEFPHILSFEEMLKKILAGSSLARFGDAEFDIAFRPENKNDPYQKPSQLLTNNLINILNYSNNNFIVAIPPLNPKTDNIIDYKGTNLTFWESYWLSRWDNINPYITNSKYGNSLFSRSSVFHELHIERIKQIWDKKDVVFVYSPKGRFIFDNRLFDNINTKHEIHIPPTHAFSEYDQIFNRCLSFPKSYLFLLSAGPTATVLAFDLHRKGYQALDIGHFSNCYLQFLGEADAPESLPMEKK